MTTPAKLVVRGFPLGDWQTNCFVVHAKAGRDCWIIDAGFEPQPLIDYIQQQQLTPRLIVQTHAHVDHIAGLAALRALWLDTPILIHEAERDFLTDPMLNLSIALADPIVAPPADRLLQHGEELELDGLTFTIRHTPGHSPGGITLYCPAAGVALVGDALFAGSIGRTDFPTSDHQTLMDAIHNQLLTLPDDTHILPGHGPASTIGQERRTNPFLRQ